MKATLLAILLIAGTGALSAQVGQDLKQAGHDTKDAATTAARKTKNGTTKAYHKSTRATKKVIHKGASETEKGAGKVSQKTATDTSTK
jgi:hypothetical protein